MSSLWDAGCTFLADVYDGRRGLFPFSTSVVDGRYESSFDHPAAARYTVNCLLALRQAHELDADRHPFPQRWRELTGEFLERNPDGLRNPGDAGLFLVLAAGDVGTAGPLGEAAVGALTTARELVESGSVARLPLQEACWVLWGLTALSGAGVEEGRVHGQRLTRLLLTEFLDAGSGMPRHSLARSRRRTVSFGGIVYFLRALHEVSSAWGDEAAEAAFRRTLDRVLAIQGADGAWPWFVDVPSGRVLDRYAVYGVHQDSMSMLFLLPALDRGLAVRDAIERSYGWVLGANELGRSLILRDPFLRYRSLERRGPLTRARRFGRALVSQAVGVRWSDRPAAHVRLNTECRSYELGWVVYAWAGRPERLALAAGERPVAFAGAA